MKYMGSKGKVAKHILPIILQNRQPNQYYVEPFVGGANLIDKVLGNRIGGDINKYLISLLDSAKYNFVPPYLSRKEVDDIKLNKDKYSDNLVGWAGIGCSYSGKWFGGYAGISETKNGEKRDYISEAINNFLLQSRYIKDVSFFNCNYFDLLIPDKSIIYCDPPYENTEGYLVKFNHLDFWEWCRVKTKEGHHVFVSEYNAPEDFECIWQKNFKSSLSANGKSGGNKTRTEKLFILKNSRNHVSQIKLF